MLADRIDHVVREIPDLDSAEHKGVAERKNMPTGIDQQEHQYYGEAQDKSDVAAERESSHLEDLDAKGICPLTASRKRGLYTPRMNLSATLAPSARIPPITQKSQQAHDRVGVHPRPEWDVMIPPPAREC